MTTAPNSHTPESILIPASTSIYQDGKEVGKNAKPLRTQATMDSKGYYTFVSGGQAYQVFSQKVVRQ